MKLLLEKGAELETKDYYGRTPLSWAAQKGHEAVVKLLLEKGAGLETKDKNYGRKPLLWAAKNRYEAVVKLLLEKGAGLETKDYFSRTPLSLAIENRHEAVAKLLLGLIYNYEIFALYYICFVNFDQEGSRGTDLYIL